MYKITLLILASLTLSACAFEKPKFCGGLECPEFNTLASEGKIEIREYQESNWVSTKMSGENNSSGFMTLFSYISGKNENNEKMAMTAPVLKKIQAKTPFTSDETLSTMSFYLGSKYQNGQGQAPKPTNDNTFLETIAYKKVAVIVFSGYSNKQKEQEQLMILGDYLKKNNIKFNTEYYFTAGYDSPFKFLWRHNEVWIELQ